MSIRPIESDTNLFKYNHYCPNFSLFINDANSISDIRTNSSINTIVKHAK